MFLFHILIAVLCLWLWQNIQHEGTHAFFVKIFGGKIIAFKPFPTWADGKILPQSFASVSYRYNEPFTSKQNALISIAPQLLNTILLTILFGMLNWFSLPYFAIIIFTALYVNNFIDGAFNLSSIFKSNSFENRSYPPDIWSFAQELDLKINFLRILVFGWLLIFGNNLLIILFNFTN